MTLAEHESVTRLPVDPAANGNAAAQHHDAAHRLFADAPTPDELVAARAYAERMIEHQDAPELRAVKNADELDAERAMAADHRAAMRAVRAQADRAEADRARRAVEVDTELAKADQRDELDGARARVQLRRMSNPVAYLATQVRVRRLALALAALPSAVAVLIGAVQVQAALVRLFDLHTNTTVYWALFFLGLLITSPLVAVLLYQAAAPGGSPTSWRELRTQRFFGVKVGLVAAEVLVNVGPHLLLREYQTALIWVSVPAAIVVSLTLLPQLNEAFSERIMSARTDAELGTPVGPLGGEVAKLLRQIRWVREADAAGDIGGYRDASGLPSRNQIYKVLVAHQGRVGRPDAIRVDVGLRLLQGFED